MWFYAFHYYYKTGMVVGTLKTHLTLSNMKFIDIIGFMQFSLLFGNISHYTSIFTIKTEQQNDIMDSI